MVKQILKLNGTSTIAQQRISQWIKTEDYTGIKVFCKTSHVMLCKIEGSFDGNTIDFMENYKFASGESNLINIKAELDYYRVSIDIPENTDVRFSCSFCELVRENKVISYLGTYDVRAFNTLDLTLFNRTTLSFPVKANLECTSYSSCGKVIDGTTALSINNKNSTTRPLSSLLQYGGYYLKSNPTDSTLLNPTVYPFSWEGSDWDFFSWNQPVTSLSSSSTGSSTQPLAIGVLESSLKSIAGAEYDDELNLIEFGQDGNFNALNSLGLVENQFTKLRFVKTSNYQEMETNIATSGSFTMYAYLKPDKFSANQILTTLYEDLVNNTYGNGIEVDFQTYTLSPNFVPQTVITFGNEIVNVDFSEPLRVAIVYDKNVKRYDVYIDGVLIGSHTVDFTLLPTMNLKVVPLESFSGRLINFRIFPQVLSAQQITELNVFDQEILTPAQSIQTIDVKGVDEVVVEAQVYNASDIRTDDFNKIHIQGLLY